ncbi:ArsR/SmtB family transcription factor [Neisseria sp. Ec49-e6-T10]|uniref:ArsR/SmtB family transcription factor n=1 Tax=Neisseria sp. Ec49-e6-T10 TaxID=3140744 RepID=UPI003EBEAE30
MDIDINETLKALSNPTRLDILTWLKEPARHFACQPVDPEEVGVSVQKIQEKAGLSQSTTSVYLASLQRAKLLKSQRIGAWTYYKRDEENIMAFQQALQNLM